MHREPMDCDQGKLRRALGIPSLAVVLGLARGEKEELLDIVWVVFGNWLKVSKKRLLDAFTWGSEEPSSGLAMFSWTGDSAIGTGGADVDSCLSWNRSKFPTPSSWDAGVTEKCVTFLESGNSLITIGVFVNGA